MAINLDTHVVSLYIPLDARQHSFTFNTSCHARNMANRKQAMCSDLYMVRITSECQFLEWIWLSRHSDTKHDFCLSFSNMFRQKMSHSCKFWICFDHECVLITILRKKAVYVLNVFSVQIPIVYTHEVANSITYVT